MKAKQDKRFPKHKNNIIDHGSVNSTRLNKYISETGLASRREADRLINDGFVKVNNEVATTGMQVFSNDIVQLRGKVISKVSNFSYILLNKESGIVSTTDQSIKGNIVDYVGYSETIFPIGRLDKETTGLILLTNDGDIVNKLLRVENGHDKEYLVKVDKPISDDFVDKMKNGVLIYNPVSHKHQITLPTKVVQVNTYTFKLTLRQGLNRQIRRMTKALDYNTVELKRIRMIHLTLGDLKEGYWRYLTNEELYELNEKIKDSNKHFE